MVLACHDKLGDTGRKTGFKDVGAQITLASPKGGRPPLHSKSQDPSFRSISPRASRRTRRASSIRRCASKGWKQKDYDTVFYPGGHGPMWDLAEDLVKLIESFLAAGKPMAQVCHAPGVSRHVKAPADPPPVEGKKVTGFADGEETDVGLTKVVPVLVEDELLSLGVLQGQELGRPRRHQRVAGHRPEPCLIRPDRQGPDRTLRPNRRAKQQCLPTLAIAVPKPALCCRVRSQ
jgi:putative intracellular protease/amidase